MLIDAHCHIKKSDEAKFLKHHDICVLVNCQTFQEFQFLKQFESEHFILSAGVHPWDRDEHALASMLEVLEQVRVVGEIGLDSVWCTVDPIQQNQVFEAQLEFAMNHKKPVLLHTKGEELAVLNHIKNYPNTYLVHWYSSEDYLEDYIV